MFAVGPGGADWLARLKRSEWYSAMRPRRADLVGSGAAGGCWAIPSNAGCTVEQLAEAFAAAELFPVAPLATVALMAGAAGEEVDATIGLVRELTGRADMRGRGVRVVVTMGAGGPDLPEVVERLRSLGAFVIRRCGPIEPDHFHHFPVRAATIPSGGQLVGVDLADYLKCWLPGQVADLHLIPFDAEAASERLRAIVPPGRLAGLNLNIHFPEDGPNSTLAAVDRLANLCRETLLSTEPGWPVLFTTRDRLDGETGTADLLLIQDAGVDATISPGVRPRRVDPDLL